LNPGAGGPRSLLTAQEERIRKKKRTSVKRISKGLESGKLARCRRERKRPNVIRDGGKGESTISRDQIKSDAAIKKGTERKTRGNYASNNVAAGEGP